MRAIACDNRTAGCRSVGRVSIRRYRRQRSTRCDRLTLNRCRSVDLKKVEQVIGGNIGEAAREEHRENAIFADGLMEGGDQMLLRDRSLGKELLHQFVLAFRYQLHQRLVRRLCRRLHLCRNLPDLALAIAARRVIERLHRDQIDDTLKALAVGNRQLYGNHCAAVAGAQGLECRLHSGCGARMIHLIQDNDTRQVELVSVLPDAVSHRLDATRGIQHHHRRFHRKHRRLGLMHEHVEARCIDQVHLDAIPFRESNRILHRRPARYFLFVIGRHRRAVFHTAKLRSHLCGMQQSGHQCCLPAVRMPHYSYVADLTSLIRLHKLLLKISSPRKRPGRIQNRESARTF